MSEFTIFFLVLLVQSTAAFVFFYYIPVRSFKQDSRPILYFSFFFLFNALGFARFFIGNYPLMIAAGNALFVLSVYSLKTGLECRTKSIKPLYLQKLAIVNVLLVFIFTYLSLLMDDMQIFRVALVNLNMAFLFCYALFVHRQEEKEKVHSKTLEVSLLVAALLFAVSWLPLYLTGDLTLHLRLVFAFITISIFVLFGGLLSLILTDVISHYYKDSITDSMTNLYNRRHFVSVGERVLRRASKINYPVCCVLCDIDHFKMVNDNYGHNVGDEVIKSVAELLNDGSRPRDIVARIGGEEFVILLDNCDLETAFSYSERLRTELESMVVSLSNPDLRVSASFGVTESSGESIKKLLKNADIALYSSKSNGRNRVSSYHQDDDA